MWLKVRYLTSTSAKSKFPAAEKLTNEALVTATHDGIYELPMAGAAADCVFSHIADASFFSMVAGGGAAQSSLPLPEGFSKDQ